MTKHGAKLRIELSFPIKFPYRSRHKFICKKSKKWFISETMQFELENGVIKHAQEAGSSTSTNSSRSMNDCLRTCKSTMTSPYLPKKISSAWYRLETVSTCIFPVRLNLATQLSRPVLMSEMLFADSVKVCPI